MKFLPQIICCNIALLITLHSFGQTNTDSLFTDFDIITFKPVTPASPQILKTENKYIRYAHAKPKAKQKLEFIRVYRDTSTYSRKAKILNFDYGTVLAFDVMKTAGYEKVLFFADQDLYFDSLLIRGDTLCFKERSNDHVELAIVYPAKNDTVVVKYGNRNTRTDFLDRFYFRPPLKNYLNWFADPYLDYTETYTLVKKDSAWDLIKVDTNREHISEYDYKRKKEEFANAGSSPFWMALTELAYY